MTFFNLKEDVIDVELTQFGKHLLSLGKWKPSYYAFYDDDIIYDYEYAGYVEPQGDIQARITGSARSRTQYNFSGIETEINRQTITIFSTNQITEDNRISIQPTNDREYALGVPMGRSNVGDENFPAWALTCLHGTISGSIPMFTSSMGTIPIIQLTGNDVRFKTSVKDKSEEEAQTLELGKTLNQIGESSPEADPSDLILANKVYSDGSYIDIEEDYFLMEILEKNTLFEEENIEIEVFKYELNQRNDQEVLVPLQFIKKKQLVVDDILVDDDDPELNQYAQLTPEYVEYFFNIWVDEEIDPETLCKAVVERKNLGLYTPPISCPEEVPKIPPPNLYGPGLPGQADVTCTPEPPCPDEEEE
jgi:hypothetical protein